jgi:hypothetical protein
VIKCNPAQYFPEAPKAPNPQVSAPVNYDAKGQFGRMKGSLWRKIAAATQFKVLWHFGNKYALTFI